MKDLTAKDVMTEAVVTVRDDFSAEEVAALLAAREISGAPVVDAAGSLLGVVSLADLARSSGEPGLRVRQIMTPIADTVSEDTTVPAIARKMVAHHYHRMVVSRREQPVGIVSSMDLLRLIAEIR